MHAHHRLQETFAETRVSLQKTINAYWWMFGICALTILILIGVLVQVIRTTRFSDPVYLLMLFFLQMTMLVQMYFFWFQISTDKILIAQIDPQVLHWDHKQYCNEAVAVSLPAVILSIATLLNISKWASYNLRVRAIRNQGQSMKNKFLALNVTSLLVICVVLVPPICYYCKGCNGNVYYNDLPKQLEQFHYEVTKPLLNFVSILYCILCLLFLIVAVHLILTLRETIPKFYEEYRCVLWTASILLSLPLSFRSILDFSADKSQKFFTYWTATDKRTLEYNVSFFFITTYFPVVC